MALFDNIYATTQDYADYIGVDISSLPSDIDSKLKKASRIVTMTISGYDSYNENHIEVTKLATCSQVEFWSLNPDNTLLPNDFTELKLGSFSIKKGDNVSNVRNKEFLNDFARGYLLKAGLLYRGLSFGNSNSSSNIVNAREL